MVRYYECLKNNELISDALTEYSDKSGLSISGSEGVFDLLAIAREVIDSKYLWEKGEEFSDVNIISSPSYVIFMLVRMIELLQGDLENVGIDATEEW